MYSGCEIKIHKFGIFPYGFFLTSRAIILWLRFGLKTKLKRYHFLCTILNHSHYVQLDMLLMTCAWKMFNFESLNASGKDLMRVKFQNLQAVEWKTTQLWLSGRSCFSHINSSNFRQLLQSLHLRYTAENLQVTYMCNFNMLLKLILTKFFNSKLFTCLLKVDHMTNYCKRPISM